jgi:hypothetical protein
VILKFVRASLRRNPPQNATDYCDINDIFLQQMEIGSMATETFDNMTLAFREKMLEVSIIAEPKKARHTYPE